MKTTENNSICGCAAPAVTAPAETAPAMTVSALKRALSAAPELPLTLLWPDGDPIEAHFHVTEIGRVQKDFVDCGGTVRRMVTCLLQTWVGEDRDHRITAGKLLKAFEHARKILGPDDPPVELEYEACNVMQFVVAAVEREPTQFVVRLGGKHTDCLAKENCGATGSCTTAGTAGQCC
jgi:hypothetical protein